MLIGNKQQCNKLPDDSNKLLFDAQFINRTEHARNLGVFFETNLSYRQHISNLCRSSFLNIRTVSIIRNLLDIETTKMLVCSLVTSRLDYCNSLYFGLPDCTISFGEPDSTVVAQRPHKLSVPGSILGCGT